MVRLLIYVFNVVFVMIVGWIVSHRLERDGKLLHFCSPECLKKFQSEAHHS